MVDHREKTPYLPILCERTPVAEEAMQYVPFNSDALTALIAWAGTTTNLAGESISRIREATAFEREHWPDTKHLLWDWDGSTESWIALNIGDWLITRAHTPSRQLRQLRIVSAYTFTTSYRPKATT